MDQVQDILPASSRRVIDLSPFDFLSSRRSALGGLGGADGITDPAYAFHTHYQACAPGPITFTLKLQDLKTSEGTLLLRIHAAPPDFSIEAKLARSAQVPLAIVQAHEGEVSLRVQARRGMVYAFVGYAYVDGEVDVSGVTVTLDRLDHSDTDADAVVEAEQTRYGAETRATGMLIAEGVPTLGAPVSQAETSDQRLDRDYARWRADLGARDGGDAWPPIFVARALEAYGMLEPGAQGLVLGDGDAELVAAMERLGCRIASQPVAAASDEAAAATPDANVDFLWSIGAASRFESVAQVGEWIEGLLEQLNFGGIAVHCFRFTAGPEAEASAPGALVFSRSDVERLAFSLLANNHETAQLSYGPSVRGPAFPETWFGLIVRRGSF